MKACFGLYAHQLNDRDFAFARQCGATQIVVHLVDYFHGLDDRKRENQSVGGSSGWGYAGKNRHLWRPDELKRLVTRANAHGLEVVAIENFDPMDWYDVLVAGPRREEQLEKLRQIVRDVGEAGIPMIGYNFSIAGVASRVSGCFARGGAVSVGMDGVDQTPIPKGMVWNMVYDAETAETALLEGEAEPTVSEEDLWSRLSYFLETLLPTAESAGVTLAAHPDDPPASEVRRQPRLVWRPELYDRLLDIHDSPNNKLEFCLGTLAEMPGHDIYQTLRHFLERNAIGYIHLRNVQGTVPEYRETFIDDGKIDVRRVVEILKEYLYDGPILPDHTPQMSCDAPWHAGMAYAMGYLNALLL
ncbi:MAG: mannonate dehydratase [Alkalispirochaeta sp.]